MRETRDRLKTCPPLGDLDRAAQRSIAWLERQQEPTGYWVGALQSNSCIEAQWVLAMHCLGVRDDPKHEGVVRSILKEQREDGSWEVYHDAPEGDLNATVECYAALRSAGHSPREERLRKARRWIVERGGLRNLRVFTKYWLALIGEWPWRHTPTVPPELIWLPPWFPLNVYHFASWARATIIPLSVLAARRPVHPLPPERRLDELFPQGRDSFDYQLTRSLPGLSWESLFLLADRLLGRYGDLAIQPGREIAIRQCLDWVIEHQDEDGAWGGIQPPWIYSLLALHTEGYGVDHPVVAKGLAAFDAHWSYERDGAIYLQASESPVWDTLLSLMALLDCGCTPREMPAMARALRWVLDAQVTVPGDWRLRVRGVAPGGWAFERANNHYPDVDDTAVAVTVLARSRDGFDDPAAIDAAIERAERWMVALQCSSGGWAAFDRDNTKAWLTKIPFCDFGEVLDPPSVDVTAHVIEALAWTGHDRSERALRRALRYIRREQEPDGSWFGRWGVNHIYGTAAVLPALRALGDPPDRPALRRAADWIAAHQNRDGGWGESPASYVDDSLRGVGDSTPSQTAWALMSLLAAESPAHEEAIARGLSFLLERQRCEGTWDEPQYTGTGFPGYGVGERRRGRPTLCPGNGTELGRGFMINYNLYRHYFPLMAIGRARRRLAGEPPMLPAR